MIPFLTGLLLTQSRPASFDFTILHTNDLHGHIFSFAYTEIGKGKNELPSVGGAARRATLIRELKKTIQNPVIVVDSGDTFTRGPLTNAYEGVSDVEAMNAVGYDIAELGNNEFKAKDAREENDAAGAQAALLRVVKRSGFSWICANATDGQGSSLQGVQPYVVREIGGVRVGFLGLTAPRSASYPQTKGWHILDPVATAKEWIPKARKDCDVLIAMTHIGVALDALLATRTKGIDAIVGGDSHTFLYKALEFKNQAGIRVPIVQDGEFGVNLGRFDLHFELSKDGGYHLVRYTYRLIPVGSEIPQAGDVLAKMEPYIKPLREVVGTVPKVGADPAERSKLTATLIAEAMRSQTHSEVGLYRKSSLFEVFRQRSVTKYDVWAAMPFKDDVATANIPGVTLKELLASPDVVYSGVKSAADVDASRTYSVAMVDFEATSTFKVPASSAIKTGLDVRDAVVRFLKTQWK